MKKILTTLAVATSIALLGSPASAEPYYPGGLPGDQTAAELRIGEDLWRIPHREEAGPADNPAYRNAREHAYAAQWLPYRQSCRSGLCRLEEGDILRRIELR